MGWIVKDFKGGIFLFIKMVDLNMFGLNGFGCNEAIFFDGRGENAVSFVVDVFSNDVDSSWGSGDEFWIGFVSCVEFLDQG